MTVMGREVGQFLSFRFCVLFTPEGLELVWAPCNPSTCSPYWSGRSLFVFKRVAMFIVSLHIIKNLTEVNLEPLYQVKAAFYFLLFYLNFQRI